MPDSQESVRVCKDCFDKGGKKVLKPVVGTDASSFLSEHSMYFCPLPTPNTLLAETPISVPDRLATAVSLLTTHNVGNTKKVLDKSELEEEYNTGL